MREPQTHRGLDPELCGVPVRLDEGVAEIELVTTTRMRADDSGLVHGGFVFGLADHAAMLAVDRPTVVLGAADVRLVAPVRVGQRLRALATVREIVGKKHVVDVEVTSDTGPVMTGAFTCFVPARHVLAEVQGEGDDARR
jgi:uncharacterized protein (TIGR00369 family)